MLNLFKKIREKLEAEKEIWNGTQTAFIFKVFGFLLGYIFTLTIAKNFQSKELGKFVITYLVIDFFCILSMWGVDTALISIITKVQGVDRLNFAKKVLIKSYLFVLIGGGVFTLVFHFLPGSVTKLFFPNENELAHTYYISSFIILPLVLSRLNAHFFRGLKKIIVFSIFNYVTIYLVAIISLFILNQIKLSPVNIYYSFFIGTFFTFVVSSFIILTTRTTKTVEVRQFKLKKLISSSTPIAFSDILVFFNSWISTLMVSMFLSSKETGWFALAVKTSILSSIIAISVNSITSPRLSQLYGSKEVTAFRKSFGFASRIIFSASFLFNLALIFLAPFALRLIGEDFVKVFPIMVVLIIAQTVESYSAASSALLPMVDKQKVLLYLVIGKNILLVSLCLLLMPSNMLNLGLSGAGIAILLTSVFYTAAISVYVKKRFDLKVKIF